MKVKKLSSKEDYLNSDWENIFPTQTSPKTLLKANLLICACNSQQMLMENM